MSEIIGGSVSLGKQKEQPNFGRLDIYCLVVGNIYPIKQIDPVATGSIEKFKLEWLANAPGFSDWRGAPR